MTDAAKRVRRTQEERSAATRAKLLDATIDCLIELGYAGTTTTLIAERAGVSRGAQLHHFPSKDALYRAVVLDSFGDWLALVDNATEGPREGWPQVERMLRAAFRFFTAAVSSGPAEGPTSAADGPMNPTNIPDVSSMCCTRSLAVHSSQGVWLAQRSGGTASTREVKAAARRR